MGSPNTIIVRSQRSEVRSGFLWCHIHIHIYTFLITTYGYMLYLYIYIFTKYIYIYIIYTCIHTFHPLPHQIRGQASWLTSGTPTALITAVPAFLRLGRKFFFPERLLEHGTHGCWTCLIGYFMGI